MEIHEFDLFLPNIHRGSPRTPWLQRYVSIPDHLLTQNP